MSTTFNSIEDMITWVTVSPEYRSVIKFTLHNFTNWEYDNEEEGKIWRAEYEALPRVSRRDEPAYTYYKTKRQEVSSRSPKQHPVINWSLEDHSLTIRLSIELAAELEKTWKVGPTYKGSSYTERKGAVTIPGMLKRLGMIGFEKQIKSAKESAEIADKKNKRNNNRVYAIKQAEELHNLLTRSTETFPAETIQLISLVISNIKNSVEV